MSGPCLAASGKRLGPYRSRRRLASAASRPDPVLLSSRRTTSSAAIACHGVASLAGPAFAAAVIGRLSPRYQYRRSNAIHRNSSTR